MLGAASDNQDQTFELEVVGKDVIDKSILIDQLRGTWMMAWR